ncbi:MAG: GNAT family N-acetyltransferase [Oscillospiraceae bacterium]|nr:GNAT family N-acetyltransferase [Oscillospiraceae bacterium]
MIFKTAATEKIRVLFKDSQDTLVWSCLDGTMGEFFTDTEEKSASAVIGDFCFLAGEINSELVENVTRDYLIMVPQNKKWSDLIVSTWGKKAHKITRYATKKEHTFDVKQLENIKLPHGFEFKMMNKELFEYCKNTPWCRDFVAQYNTYEQFVKLGLGVMVTKDGVPVSGASSYSAYKDGIEIQVDTLSGHRRQGLAYFACAQLILKCLEKGIFPSWDAHNLTSLTLARKLGYEFAYSYTAYEISKQNGC